VTDTATIWFPDRNTGDWQLDGARLRTGDDLLTAILISLFTDRQANPEDVIPDGSDDPRGWCGDEGRSVPIGSRLWLLEREKQTQETLNRAREYIVEALQWLIDDGVVAKIDVSTEWVRRSFLGAQITVYRNDGTTRALNYSWAWQGVG
jgi:phage gp46-like protein